jgi:hypothetical protein
VSVQANHVPLSRVAERGGNPVTRLIHNYIFWAYDRGSLHYDIMVTAILLFIFVGPRYINFHDRPVPTVPLREAAIVVKPNGIVNGRQRYLYEIRSDDLGIPKDGTALRDAVEDAIEPISGAVTILRIDQVQDASHKVVAYDVTALR